MTGYKILKSENLPESLKGKPRWMICVVFTAGLLIMTLSAISAGIFIGYTYCYVEHRTALKTGNITQVKDLQLISFSLPETEEAAQKRTINGALGSSIFVQKILNIGHTLLDHEHSYIPGPNDKVLYEYSGNELLQ